MQYIVYDNMVILSVRQMSTRNQTRVEVSNATCNHKQSSKQRISYNKILTKPQSGVYFIDRQVTKI